MNSHPPRPAIGVSVIVFDAQDRLLLVQRAQPPSLGLWHPPGGKLEAGESLLQACRREVWEETGLTVEIGPLLAVVERRLEGFHYIILDFLATQYDASAPLRPADDALQARWVEQQHLPDYPMPEGLLPILARAEHARRGACLGLHDLQGDGTDFIPYTY
ncbi:MAG: NUDIX domain-containing protein [Methylococcaceae bacterium]|nr:MAG: NUDIX domain-containing protein [Methylococcaceae bacterium]